MGNDDRPVVIDIDFLWGRVNGDNGTANRSEFTDRFLKLLRKVVNMLFASMKACAEDPSRQPRVSITTADTLG